MDLVPRVLPGATIVNSMVNGKSSVFGNSHDFDFAMTGKIRSESKKTRFRSF
jgi:hypothetical protein